MNCLRFLPFLLFAIAWEKPAHSADEVCSKLMTSSAPNAAIEWSPQTAQQFFAEAPFIIENQVALMEKHYEEGLHPELTMTYQNLKKSLRLHLSQLEVSELRSWISTFVDQLSPEYRPAAGGGIATFTEMEESLGQSATSGEEDRRAQDFLQVCCALANSIKPYEEMMELSLLNESLFSHFVAGLKANLLGHLALQAYKHQVTSSDPQSPLPEDKPACASCAPSSLTGSK